MRLITPEYQRLNTELHAKDDDWGRTHQFTVDMVERLVQRYDCETILDYGCGKGILPGARYDPAIPAYAAPPEPADLVVCSAVLEHVEFMSLYPVLNDLERLTKRAVFITITTVPSSKTLGDGRNAHVSVYPVGWWITGLAQRWTLKAVENMGSWFWFMGKKK